MTTLLDASALLAFVLDEAGADMVEQALVDGAACTTVNWSEVAQKVLAAGRDWSLVRSLLLSYDLRIEPVIAADGEWAAARWRRGEGLAIADRICLGVAARLRCEILTADAAWGEDDPVRQLR